MPKTILHVICTLQSLITNIAGFVIYLVMLTNVDPVLIAVILATTLVGYFINKYLSGYGYRHRDEIGDIENKLVYSSRIAQEKGISKDIRIFNMRPWLEELYTKILDAYDAYRKRESNVVIWGSIADLVLTFLRNGVAYFYLIKMVVNGGLSVSEFLLYFSTVGGFTGWVGGILGGFTRLHRQSLDICTVREFLEYPELFKFADGKPLDVDKSKQYVIKLDDVSFTANSGEILGIAGISGCGQKELLEAIAGLQPTENGSICYVEDDGTREELLGKDPLSIAEMGVALSFVPEDRLGMGLVGNMDLSDNMMLRSFRKGRGILTDRKSPRKLAETVVEELDVNTPGVTTPVRRLSGGNVQKVLVGREIASAPTVLLTAYAVRGLDINASYTIYDLINRQKERGVAVIYVGEDLDVLLELADRILVLCGGKVSGIVPGRGATKRDVGMMMTQLGGNEAHA